MKSLSNTVWGLGLRVRNSCSPFLQKNMQKAGVSKNQSFLVLRLLECAALEGCFDVPRQQRPNVLQHTISLEVLLWDPTKSLSHCTSLDIGWQNLRTGRLHLLPAIEV